MRKLVSLSIVFCCMISFAVAQQAPQYSLYMFNKLNWNPAYAGLDHSLSLTGGLRSQWTEIEGNPETQYVYLHAPLLFASSGVGIGLENDNIGAQINTTIQLAYSYQLNLGDSKILSFGIGGNFIQRTLDGSLLRTPDGIYENIINHQDDILPNTRENATAVSFSAGIYYYSETIEGGISVDHVSEPTVDFTTFSPTLSRTITGFIGTNLDISSSISFHPSLIVASDLTQTQPQLSAIFKYNDNIFGGGALRGYNNETLDAFTIIAGFKLGENITFGYAYDISLSGLRVISNESHEIVLNYNLNTSFGQGRPPKIIYNPRNL